MRETNLNRPINRTELKVGDKIAISREVTVKAVRETTLHAGFGNPRKPVTIIDTDDGTLAITSDETLKLLERDKEPTFTIPPNAIIITWKDDDDYDHIARRDSVSEKWATSSEGPNNTYTTDALVAGIEDGDFDGYKEGSFEVLKSKPDFYYGGVTLGQESMRRLRDQMGINVLTQNFPPRGVVSSVPVIA